jgi:hypothetical protein
MHSRFANPLSRQRSYTRAPISRLSSSTSQYFADHVTEEGKEGTGRWERGRIEAIAEAMVVRAGRAGESLSSCVMRGHTVA